jgi:CRP-like cAMP-binding protein
MSRLDLLTFSLFQGFSAEQVDHLLTLMEEHTYAADTEIFAQGARAEFFYILFRGEVTIRYKPYDGPSLVVARILPGGVFGWSAALGRKAYTASTIALRNGSAYRLRAEKLQKLCDQYPETGAILLKKLTEVISQRVQVTHDQVFRILNQGMSSSGNCARELENGSG